MKSPLISIIVPVYGVEQYLDRCVDSIINQTYTNLEIVLVDDGSPDNCPSMCDHWAEKDSRIRVIHKENGGLSDARNAGVVMATGELIGFVDSDDWVSPDMYQLLYDNMVEMDSDISACGIRMVWEDDTPSRMLTREGCCVLNQEEAMEAIMEESWLKHPVVCRLYKADLIRGILFPVGKYHEDAYWSYQIIGAAQKVSVFDTPCYIYTQRSGSIMGETYSIRRLDLLEAYWNELQYVYDKYPALRGKGVALFGSRLVYSCQCILKMPAGEEKERCYARYRRFHAKWKGFKYQGRPARGKPSVWYLMACMSVRLTATIRNMLNVGF